MTDTRLSPEQYSQSYAWSAEAKSAHGTGSYSSSAVDPLWDFVYASYFEKGKAATIEAYRVMLWSVRAADGIMDEEMYGGQHEDN